MIHVYNLLYFPNNSNYSKNYMCVTRPVYYYKVAAKCLLYICKTRNKRLHLPLVHEKYKLITKYCILKTI